MLQLFEYELPFRASFQTGTSTYKTRKGILLHYQENGTDFIVEASPLPGFSRDSILEVKQTLLDQKRFIEDFLSGDLNLQKIQNLSDVEVLAFPSIQFSLSFLGLSILAHRKKETMYNLFGQKTPQQISINDVIGFGTIEEMKKKVESSIKKGFRILKIKAPHPVDELADLLETIHKNHSEVQFRIDANQSWPQKKLRTNCDLLRYLPIEYIEEPCTINEWNDIYEIQQICSLPMALDESIFSISQLKKALKLFPNLVLIIKPMLLGNFLKIHETISQFRSNFNKIVVTTSLESRVGRSIIASTASLIGDLQMKHGLHTGHLFNDDLLPDFEIKSGSVINLSKNPAIKSFSDIKTSYLKKLG